MIFSEVKFEFIFVAEMTNDITESKTNVMYVKGG